MGMPLELMWDRLSITSVFPRTRCPQASPMCAALEVSLRI